MIEISEISKVANPPTRYGKLSAALPRITNGALALAVAPMIYLHLVSIGRLDPLHTTVSDYVSVPGGAVLLAISTLALAVAAVSLPAQLAAAGRPVPATARISLALGCVGLLASVVFPTNVLGTVPDESTVLHRYAAALFFVAVPIAAWSLARAAVRVGSPTPATGRFAVVSVLVGIAFLFSHIPLVFPASPHADLIATALPRGLAERVLLVVDGCALAVIASSAKPARHAGPAQLRQQPHQPTHISQPTRPARPAQPAQPTRMVRR